MNSTPTWQEEFEKTIFAKSGGSCFECSDFEGMYVNLKAFIAAQIEKTAKAFGGCTRCYGKGYATQIENWSGRGESDIGQGDVVIDEAAPYYVPCSCDRGKQFGKAIKKIYVQAVEDAIRLERARILAALPQERGWRGLMRGQSYQRPDDQGFDQCLSEVRVIIED